MRIGFGCDVHQLQSGLPLVLGGVSIPHHQGIVATSDGDVLLHAVTDALLGAAALGDLGSFYPSDDANMTNIDSRLLLRDTVSRLKQHGFSVNNIDATIVIQAPKIAPFVLTMREHLAADCEVTLAAVNVKATTTDHLGFIGAEKGLAAYAVLTIKA